MLEMTIDAAVAKKKRSLPMLNRKMILDSIDESDCCQTPDHAVWPMLPYLKPHSVIWEPCCGKGNIARVLRAAGHTVIAHDLHEGAHWNFFSYAPDDYDYIITNPFYTGKYRMIERCYKLGKPWALLVPFTTMAAGRALELYKTHGAWEELRPTSRISFEMPKSGYDNAGAQFNTTWLTWKVLPCPLTIVDLEAPLPHQQIRRPKKSKRAAEYQSHETEAVSADPS